MAIAAAYKTVLTTSIRKATEPSTMAIIRFGSHHVLPDATSWDPNETESEVFEGGLGFLQAFFGVGEEHQRLLVIEEGVVDTGKTW